MLITSNDIDAEVDKKRICSYLGYCADCEPPSRISSLIDEYAENAPYLFDPAYSYDIKNIERVDDSSVFIEDSIVLRSQVIARLLEQCCQVSLFVATIGNQLEEMARQLAEDGFIVQSAVLDTIGSDAAERVAGFVQDQIEEIASAHGLCTSPRFSPGYCDWDISQQKMVFQAVDSESVGVCLTQECLMIPCKSVSGIIGIGPGDIGVGQYNPCKRCDRDDCPGRRNV
ncbi:hypothetical protein ES707_10181 [subsurface metagenome]